MMHLKQQKYQSYKKNEMEIKDFFPLSIAVRDANIYEYSYTREPYVDAKVNGNESLPIDTVLIDADNNIAKESNGSAAFIAEDRDLTSDYIELTDMDNVINNSDRVIKHERVESVFEDAEGLILKDEMKKEREVRRQKRMSDADDLSNDELLYASAAATAAMAAAVNSSSKSPSYQDSPREISIENIVLSNSLKQSLQHQSKQIKLQHQHEIGTHARGSSLSSTSSVNNYNQRISKYNFIKEIGNGNFAKVFLVERDKSKIYALKQQKMPVDTTVFDPKRISIDREIEILNRISIRANKRCPFIIRAYECFSNASWIHTDEMDDHSRDQQYLIYNIVLEYAPNGTLFEFLQHHGADLSRHDQIIFIGCAVCAIEYLHSYVPNCAILYRDLKTENVLLDEFGYLKLTDFGSSKIVDTTHSRTYTICGTPEYFSPELINGKSGYGVKNDIWEIGILMYEILNGFTPFSMATLSQANMEYNPQKLIQKRIVNDPLIFPYDFTDSVAKHLLQHMLEKSEFKRWSIDKIKNHDYFRSIDWDDLYDKTLKLDFISQILSAT